MRVTSYLLLILPILILSLNLLLKLYSWDILLEVVCLSIHVKLTRDTLAKQQAEEGQPSYQTHSNEEVTCKAPVLAIVNTSS